jgi:hypothetical protein
MLGKKLLWLVLAAGILSSNGCCAFWERVCDRHHPQCYQPTACPTTCAPACPATPCYSPPPGTAVPVPNAPAPTGWRCP